MVNQAFKSLVKIEAIWKKEKGILWTMKATVQDRDNLNRHGRPVYIKWSDTLSAFPFYRTKEGNTKKDLVQFDENILESYNEMIFMVQTKKATFTLGHKIEKGRVIDYVKNIEIWVFEKAKPEDTTYSKQVCSFQYEETELFTF